MHIIVMWAFALLAAAPAVRAGAQQMAAARTIGLRPATARLAEEFTKVTSVRELSDGRVLITDEKENRLVVANFATGAVTPLGRKGSGPGEYSQVTRVWALGGDSSLMADGFLQRWLVYDGDRSIATLGGDTPVIRAAGSRPKGADAKGYVAGIRYAIPAGGGRANLADSFYVLRISRATGHADTLGRVPSDMAGSAGREEPASPGGAPRTRPMYVVSVNGRDEIALFADGAIAIARVNPYRVDWCIASAPCTTGPVLLAQHPPLTQRDKQAQLDRAARTRAWPPTQNVDETTGWPERAPPFTTRSEHMDGSPLLPMPDGRLLVLRYATADVPPTRYDIIDRRGVREAQLVLPGSATVAGFGAASIYIVETDDDGIQRLRRHPWP